jgi:hypothetical protein
VAERTSNISQPLKMLQYSCFNLLVSLTKEEKSKEIAHENTDVVPIVSADAVGSKENKQPFA